MAVTLRGRRQHWLVIVLLVAFTGCALRGNSAEMHPTPQRAQERLDSYPLGTLVDVRLQSGEQVRGTLVWVDSESVSVEVNAAEAARVIPRASIVDVSEYTTAGHKARNIGYWILVGVPLALIVMVIVAHATCTNC